MRSAILMVLLSAAAAASASPAAAWDYAGHRIVGQIADIVLQRDYPDAYARALALLEKKEGAAVEKRVLRDVAVFPDCAKDEPTFCGRRASPEEIEYVLRNNEHKTFHYTNSPFQQRAYLAGGVGTGETDVVQMINHVFEQLQGKRPYFKFCVKLEGAEPLWLLAHLVGDVHQPLHVGQAYFDTTCTRKNNPNASKAIEAVTTLGGNTVKLTGNEAPSLHIYWDSNTVAKAMQNEGLDEQAFARKMAEAPPADWQSTGAPETWAEQWIAQTMPLTDEAYQIKIEHDPTKDTKPLPFPTATIACGLKTTITPEYEAQSAKRAREQLHKAGYRLAAIVAAVFKPN